MRPLRSDAARVWAISWILTASFAAASAAAADDAAPEPMAIADGLEVRELTPDAWVVTSYDPWPANALLVRMTEGTAVLVDSPPTSELTRRLLDWAEAELRPERWVAINSHYHVDATGGNLVLIERGARIWASRATGDLLAERGVRMLDQLRAEHEGLFDGERVAQPTDLFEPSQGGVLRFGDEEVHLLFPGASHSSDLVVVSFPDRGILYGGCMLKVGSSAGYLGDADLRSWPGAVERLRSLDARWVVPGHGLRFGAGLLDNTLHVLAPLTADD